MLNVVRGKINKPGASLLLEDYLRELGIEGELYFGYPILGSADESMYVEAALISPKHGLVIFDIEESNNLNISDKINLQDNLYNKFEAKLKEHKNLNNRRKLMSPIEVVTFAPNILFEEKEQDAVILKTKEELEELLDSIIWETPSYYSALLSAIQTVSTIKQVPKREKVKSNSSKGFKLKKLEESIANLDKYQSSAVIETAEGPQRIRGLAGSGKTIVLALKVAYLHAQNPDWDIAVTFNTRSLKNQFIDLIRRFTYEHMKEEPNWKKVKIIHAWGSPNSEGIYYNICKEHNAEYYDFSTARAIFNPERGREFNDICEKLLLDIKNFSQMYDVILIDEAQDFTDSFLKLCFNILRDPKRLIWAYDELQNLNKTTMKSPEEIFGKDKNGNDLVKLENKPKQPKQDIILEKCYRNSKPVLTLAHSLGFGIYREELVQMFDDVALWRDIGYDSNKGEIKLGHKVCLERNENTSPKFLEEHSPIDDLIISKVFSSQREQSEWIATQILKNLTEDELEYKDIVVIHSNPRTTQSETGELRVLLYNKGINSHLVGVTTSKDGFFEEDSITITSINRAKGNEAAMVYIMDSHECYSGFELIRKRNILFTAITRSKAWVRICGIGKEMEKLEKEIVETKLKNYKLEFIYPTEEEMNKLNIIHRDRSESEKTELVKQSKNMKELLEALRDNKIKIEDLGEFKNQIKEFLKDE